MAKVRDSPVPLTETCQVHHFLVMSQWQNRNLPLLSAGKPGPGDG